MAFAISSCPVIPALYTSSLTSGTWMQGTTKVYKLSLKPETWTYQLTLATSPSSTNLGFSDDYPLAFDGTATGNYSITSYRYNEGNTKSRTPLRTAGA